MKTSQEILNENLIGINKEAISKHHDFLPSILKAMEEYKNQEPKLNREDLMDKLEEIQLRNYRTFMGTNEANLMTREEIADLILKTDYGQK